MLTRIIEEFKYSKNCKYYININLLLERLLGYEVCSCKDFESDQTIEEGNTYNFGARISHDFYYKIIGDGDSFYVVIQIHHSSDVRHSYDKNHNCNYTEPILLKFEDYQDFFDLIDETITENATFDIVIDGRTYLVTPQIKSEFLQIYCVDEARSISGICADEDEELTEQIREYNKRVENIKNLILTLRNIAKLK